MSVPTCPKELEEYEGVKTMNHNDEFDNEFDSKTLKTSLTWMEENELDRLIPQMVRHGSYAHVECRPKGLQG